MNLLEYVYPNLNMIMFARNIKGNKEQHDDTEHNWINRVCVCVCVILIVTQTPPNKRM